MKPHPVIYFAVALLLSTPLLVADDAPAKCPMCAAHKSASTNDNAALTQVREQAMQLQAIVTKMNESVGPEKLEAIAAAVNRLAATTQLLLDQHEVSPAAPEGEPAHHH